MVEIEIVLGRCDCFSGFYDVAHVCWKTKKIYLVAEKEDYQMVTDNIFAVLNHETLHLVIWSLEGLITTIKFDNCFSPETKINGMIVREDGTPT